MSLFARLTEAVGKLKPDQMKLLSMLVLDSLHQHRTEKKNWGDEAAAKMAKLGILVPEVTAKEKLGWQMRKLLRVAGELEKLGLIEIRKRSYTVDQDVYGPYGKKRLYTKQRPVVDIKFVVTKPGYLTFKEQKA